MNAARTLNDLVVFRTRAGRALFHESRSAWTFPVGGQSRRAGLPLLTWVRHRIPPNVERLLQMPVGFDPGKARRCVWLGSYEPSVQDPGCDRARLATGGMASKSVQRWSIGANLVVTFMGAAFDLGQRDDNIPRHSFGRRSIRQRVDSRRRNPVCCRNPLARLGRPTCGCARPQAHRHRWPRDRRRIGAPLSRVAEPSHQTLNLSDDPVVGSGAARRG
jgi:hypothetical protein